jgi:Ca2+-binding RTX toxin-like protein
LALPLTLPSRSLTRPVRAPSVGVVRRLFALAAFAGVCVVAVPSSRAGTIVANVADGILTVNGTIDGDDVAVRCESGLVTVNHHHPSGGPTACADLRRILVFAGEGPDRVSLVDVTPTAFDRLTATSVSGQLGDDALIGSGIGDDLIGGGGVDSLMGGQGRDHLTPGPGGGEANGGKGRDTVSLAGDGDWKINDGRSRLVQADEITTLGSIEIAAITGGPGANLIFGDSFTGNLRLKGRSGGDLLQAGEGNDRILGGGGNDFVQAGSGDDELEGGMGDDSLSGESDKDELRGGGGADTCRGGPGADSLVSC